eukprot:GILK01015486.1.p1 GENE.GILK01015486.1~~GILK01015486.1.p1  ORF type:complete len:861 (-),score=-0.39 GILK01015486.1:244-2727(-)
MPTSTTTETSTLAPPLPTRPASRTVIVERFRTWTRSLQLTEAPAEPIPENRSAEGTNAPYYTRAEVTSPPVVVSVSVTTGVVAVGSGPLSGIDSLMSIQLLSILSTMSCKVPGVGGNSMKNFLTPLKVDLGNYGSLVGQIILCAAVFSVYGLALAALTMVYTYEKATNVLRHPRLLPIMHQLLFSGLAYECCMLAYGNASPTPGERAVGCIVLALCLISVIAYPIVTHLGFIPWHDSPVERSAVSHRLDVDKWPGDDVPAELDNDGADAKEASLSRRERVAKVFCGTAMEESYGSYTEEDLGMVWAPLRYTVTPKTYWLRPVLRTSRCVHSGLRPERARLAVAHAMYRAALICIVCSVPAQSESWCSGILITAAVICFLHAMFILWTWCFRIPLENIAQALQSAAVGAVAVSNAVEADDSVATSIAMVMMAGSFLAMIIGVLSFYVEWQILSPCLVKRLDEMVINEVSMCNPSFALGANNLLGADIFGSGMPALDISHVSSSQSQSQRRKTRHPGDMDTSFGVLSMQSLSTSLAAEGLMKGFTELSATSPNGALFIGTSDREHHHANNSSGLGSGPDSAVQRRSGRSQAQTQSPRLFGMIDSMMCSNSVQVHQLGKRGSKQIVVGTTEQGNMSFSSVQHHQYASPIDQSISYPSLMGIPAKNAHIEDIKDWASESEYATTPSAPTSIVTTSLRVVSNQHSAQLRAEQVKLYSPEDSQNSVSGLRSRFGQHCNKNPQNVHVVVNPMSKLASPNLINQSAPRFFDQPVLERRRARNLEFFFEDHEGNNQRTDEVRKRHTVEDSSECDRSIRSETKIPSSKGSWMFDPED